MKKISLAAAVLLLASTIASAASSRMSFTERYGVLSERNIFLKDRTQATTHPSASTQPTHTDPEHAMALTGIVFEDNAYHAYVESSAGSVTRLNVGDAIARGKVTGIQLDGMTYQGSTTLPTLVMIGNDLTGEAAAWLAGTSTLSAAASTMPSGVEGLNMNDPNLTMEQRLKLRRMQELKGK